MPSKFWETAPPGFKARSELEARAKKLAQDEGTAFDQATGGAGFSQPIRPPSQNLSQKLRTGRVLPSQPAQNRPKFQGPSPTPGGSGFTSTRAAQPRIVHEPLQIKEKPLTRAHGFTPPNPLQIAAKNVKNTLVGNVTDVGKTVIGSVAASHPEWQPGLKKKGLLPGEEPTVGGTLAGLAGFMGRAYTPDEIAGNPLLALGPEAQIAGDIAMKVAGPVARQVFQGVKGYPKALVETAPRIVPERQAMGLAKKDMPKLSPFKEGTKVRILSETERQAAETIRDAKMQEVDDLIASGKKRIEDATLLKGDAKVRAEASMAQLEEARASLAADTNAERWRGKKEWGAKNLLSDKMAELQQARAVPPAAKAGQAKEPFEQLSREEIVGADGRQRYGRMLTASVNEPWKLRGIEYDDIVQPLGSNRILVKNIKKHKSLVRTALREGKPVPAEVLAEYGLAAKATSTERLSKEPKLVTSSEWNALTPEQRVAYSKDPLIRQGWQQTIIDRVQTLDASNAKDTEYRGLLSTGSKASLRQGETWRDRALNFAKATPDERATSTERLSKVQQPQAPLSKAGAPAVPPAAKTEATMAEWGKMTESEKGAFVSRGGRLTDEPGRVKSTASVEDELAAEKRVPGRFQGGRASNGKAYLTTERGQEVPKLAELVDDGILDLTTVRTVEEGQAIPQGSLIPGRFARNSKGQPTDIFYDIDLTQSRLAKAQSAQAPLSKAGETVPSPVQSAGQVAENLPPAAAREARPFPEGPNPSVEGAAFPTGEPVVSVEGAGEGAMPPFGPEAGPPIPKQERVPLWQQAEAGQPPPPVKPPVTEQVPSGLPSGRQPGGIQNQQPYNPQDAYQQLQAATAPANLSFKEQLGKVWQAVWSKMADRVDTLKALEQKTGIPAYKLARLVPGATEHGEGIAKRFFDPVTKKVGKDYKHLQDYMILMRNQDLLVRNPSVRLPGGINGWQGTLQAMNALKAKVGAERFAKIEATADELWAVAKKYTIDERVGTFLDNEGATRITSAHPHHIPFKRQGFEDFNRPFTTPEASVSNTGLKKMSIYGSDLPLDEPLAHMRAQIIRTQVYKARNEAAEAVVRGAEKLQELTGEQIVTWIEPKGEMSRITKVTGETFNRAKKAEHSMTRETVSFFKDGKKYTAEIPTIYARAAKSMDKQAVNFWSKVARLSTAPIRYGATSWNPGFLPLNILRDAQGALFKERLIPFSLDYWKGWLSVLKKDEWYWKASDANTFMSGIVDSMKTTDAMSRGRNLGGIQVKNPVDALLVPFRLIEAANLLSERGTRVAVFRKLTAEGVSPLEVAIRTREATVDFSKSGTVMQVINQVIPFSNAALQGTIITAQTIRKNPKQAAAIASLFMVPTILSRVNNMRFETSELIPDYEYTNNWVFQFGEYTDAKTGVKNPLYVKIPKGPIAGPVSFPGEALFNLMRKTDDRSAAQIILESAAEAAKSASPIDPSIAGVMPSVAQTGVGLATNYDLFTGSPIVPQGESNLLPEQQFDENTSKAAVALGQGTHTSPRLIDWAIQNTAGGASEVTSWMVDLGLGALGYNPEVYGGVEPKADVQGLSQTPVVRRFVGTKGTQIERRGWDNLDSATDSTNRTFNALPEVNSLGVRLGQVGDTIERTELTPQQRADYQKLMSEVVTPGVKAVISSDEFKKMAKDKKLETIQKEMASLKEATREQFLRTLPPEQLTPEAQQYLGKQEASRTLKPYFDIKESTFTQYGKTVVPNGKNGTTTLKNFIENTETLIRKARKLTGKELAAALVEIRVNKATRAWRTFDKLVKKKKLQWRMQHPENGDILWKYYGIKPIGR